MDTRATIAVIEDEAIIASSVAKRLQAEGYRVELAGDGPTGIALVERLRPDLVILDLGLPGMDGIEVCRRIQRDRHVPVLMLTARDDETDLIVGLGVGADDYVTKPFSPRELVARIAALLRRADHASGTLGTDERLIIGELAIDTGRRQVTRAGSSVHLTATEFDLLLRLAHRPGVVCTRDQLLHDVWGFRDGASTRTVDSHVASLRRKLGAELIRTAHGVGYALEETTRRGPNGPTS
ncbi:MAG: response regulator transcription factor [Nitriliruptor sp.]|uniref:response regulator transcription factor n=1 Tax=Nitriliruptor sp. TaxID=2448056 RepID=UPI0034A07B2F